MKKIFLVETKKLFKSPTIVGYLLIPLLLYILVEPLQGPLIAFSFSLILQSLFISFFVYGSKIKDYLNPTMEKKMNNSENKKFDAMFSIFVLSVSVLLISIAVPFSLMLISTQGLNQYLDSQWGYWSSTNAAADHYLYGIEGDKLLIFYSFGTFMQFLFAFSIIVVSVFGFSTLLTEVLRDSSKYLAASLSIFIIVVLFSSLTSKELYVLGDDQYIKSIDLVKNHFFKFIKLINPIFWLNQLLLNTLIADDGSGFYLTIENGAKIPDSIDAPGMLYPSVFNIFHIGTDVSSLTNDSLEYISKPVNTLNVEVYQLGTLLSPIIFASSCWTTYILKELI